MTFSKIFNASLIYSTFRTATPIIYAALCAAITQQADILNIGTEGIMLFGAFMAVAVSYLTGSWALGVLVAMFGGLCIAMVMAVSHLKFRSDICAIGMGVNMFAVAITKFLLNAWLKQSGTFADPKIIPIPKVHIKAIEKIGFLNDTFNDWTITEWFVIILIIVLWFVFYKTVWGLRIRAVGRMAQAAQTAGINVDSMKYQAIAISGLVGGLAGAHLSLGYSAMFVENMTNARGFMGVAAMYFGGAHPIITALGCFFFGFADSVGARLQAYGVPSQLVLLMPYVATIAVLAISMATKSAMEKKRKSSLITAA
ncbi:putative ABC-type transport system, permease component [Lachnospiraceae bacterium JC7]|nr:putative ABC-type transport system, permease component [Lachnospiraceae bacterium JC7]